MAGSATFGAVVPLFCDPPVREEIRVHIYESCDVKMFLELNNLDNNNPVVPLIIKTV
jgi:hypothetical protein